jgi:hypothetical protein
MKKLFILLVLLCGCARSDPTTVWMETKQWQVLDIREPMTPEEIKKCRIPYRDSFGMPINIQYRIMTIKNGDEIKEVIVK